MQKRQNSREKLSQMDLYVPLFSRCVAEGGDGPALRGPIDLAVDYNYGKHQKYENKKKQP